MLSRIGVLLFGLALGACSTPPTGTDSSITPGTRLNGRMAVRVEGDSSRSFSASFELQGTAESGQLLLSSALGTSVAQARWTPQQIRLQTTDGDYRFADLTSLAEEALGQPIPLAAMIDWLHARPWPAATSVPLEAADPGKGFVQLGWEVLLDRYQDGLVIATRRQPAPVVSVRAKLDPP